MVFGVRPGERPRALFLAEYVAWDSAVEFCMLFPYYPSAYNPPMIPALTNHRDAIAALCRRFGVSRLDVFGSAARGTDFNPSTSDVDFLVSFDLPAPGSRLDRFLGLKDSLEELLGRSVDLVGHKGLRNRFFIADVEASKEFLYAA